MSEHLAPIDPQNPGFDPAEPNTRGVTVFIVLFLVTFVLVIAASAVYFEYIREHQEESAVASQPSQELAALHARENLQTRTYGFINREKGLVQIPLERAMALIAQEAAEGKLKYAMKPTPVKAADPAPAATPAAAGGEAKK